MVEFKQILGRGTRLFDGKYFFTLYDFVGASKNFQDAEWDGDPFCPVCGNYPCSCNKKPKICPRCGNDPCTCPPPPPPQPCPICGNLPCTCPGGKPKKKVVVKLSPTRAINLRTNWEERVQYGDELITIEEYIKKLFGELPKFLKGEDDLRYKWSQPDTREQLLDLLERSGFQEDKLNLMRKFLDMEKCDMMDVLAFLAYETTPMEREKRAEILRSDMEKHLTKTQQDFMNYILSMYVENGFKELGMDKLNTMIKMKYNSIYDAIRLLNMQPQDLRNFFLNMQKDLYNGQHVVNLTVHNHFNGPIGSFYNNKD
jgi:type I restriction enzyme R subunit